MKNTQYKRIVYLILVLIWMLMIFMFSMENGNQSKQTSRGVTKVIVRVLTFNQELTETQFEQKVEKTDIIIRKLAHYSIYALGGILIFNFINTYNVKTKRKIIISILVALLYAISDEIHQYFVSDRSARILDICIDTLGAITGVLLIYLIKHRKPLS